MKIKLETKYEFPSKCLIKILNKSQVNSSHRFIVFYEVRESSIQFFVKVIQLLHPSYVGLNKINLHKVHYPELREGLFSLQLSQLFSSLFFGVSLLNKLYCFLHKDRTQFLTFQNVFNSHPIPCTLGITTLRPCPSLLCKYGGCLSILSAFSFNPPDTGSVGL